VVDDFTAAGLPTSTARDNTPQNCASLNRSQLITTDAVSVYSFDDPAAAQKLADAYGEGGHKNGSIVLQYIGARTPEDRQVAYEAELAKFLDQQ
jgi:hypothetical protein